MDIVREDVAAAAKQVDARQLEGSSILITGAAGFLCSYFADFVHYLNTNVFKDPCKIIAVDNLKTGVARNLEHIKDNFEFIKADLTKDTVDRDVDYIIHGASIASPTFYRKFPLETMNANVVGCQNMLELARKVDAKSFIFISTSEVYGDPVADAVPTKEDYRGNVSCTGPRACYDESKRYGETLCVTYHQVYGVPVKMTRPFNFFGPRLMLNDRRVIPDLLRDALSGKDPVLLSDGTTTRSFCYISDAVAGHFKVLLSNFNGESFNIGNDEIEISMCKLAEIIAELVDPKLSVKLETSSDVNYLKDNPQRRCPDITKIRTKLGYVPQVSLRDGLARTIQWHKTEGAV